jgi:cytochrome c biogenesis protein CcmG, thiol:disulfide interchange protein DsbE
MQIVRPFLESGRNKTVPHRIFFLFLVVAFLINPAAGAASGKPGDVFPDLASFGLEGKLPEIKGKIVLIDFFASWCAPCHESFPAMEQVHRSFTEKGVVVVAISVDSKKADLDRFLKKHPVGFAILRDPAGKLAAELKIATMPTSFVLGRDGKIQSIHNGFHGEQTRKEYESEIERLLH